MTQLIDYVLNAFLWENNKNIVKSIITKDIVNIKIICWATKQIIILYVTDCYLLFLGYYLILINLPFMYIVVLCTYSREVSNIISNANT